MNAPLPRLRSPRTEKFIPEWRQAKWRGFDLVTNSSGGGVSPFTLWGREFQAYRNLNLSIYSRQGCNGACPFCVEALRPVARGGSLARQKRVEGDTARYLAALESTLAAVAPLRPSISLTGGEPSLDPLLPELLERLPLATPRRITISTNGSGLLKELKGRRVIEWLTAAGAAHLNLSRHHPEAATAARLMALPVAVDDLQVRRCVALAREGGCRVRLSCVVMGGGVEDRAGMEEYLALARELGVDNVVFRGLMRTPSSPVPDPVVAFSDAHRLPLDPIFAELERSAGWSFVKQVMGYYYYVEVWSWRGIAVVLEEADLGWLEESKRRLPGVINELVFHPNGRLATTWQPWDGVVGPPRAAA